MKVIQKNQTEIQQCYDNALTNNPHLDGSADFEWQVAANGTVTFVNVKNVNLKNGEELLACVKAVFGKMVFPASQNGNTTTSTIGLPFTRSGGN